MIVPFLLLIIVFISLFLLLINLKNDHGNNLVESIVFDEIKFQITLRILEEVDEAYTRVK